MKLELKHLAPYLPYGLECITYFDGAGLIRGMDANLMLNIIDRSTSYMPIMRQLSDLTKEIEVNGETFVPMIKLLELEDTASFNSESITVKFDTKIISCEWNTYQYLSEKEATVKYVVDTTNIGELIYSFTYSVNFRRFARRNESTNRPLGVGYQIDLFQKLFEWHFDVFGLIDEKLAIDINTLKK